MAKEVFFFFFFACESGIRFSTPSSCRCVLAEGQKEADHLARGVGAFPIGARAEFRAAGPGMSGAMDLPSFGDDVAQSVEVDVPGDGVLALSLIHI